MPLFSLFPRRMKLAPTVLCLCLPWLWRSPQAATASVTLGILYTSRHAPPLTCQDHPRAKWDLLRERTCCWSQLLQGELIDHGQPNPQDHHFDGFRFIVVVIVQIPLFLPKENKARVASNKRYYNSNIDGDWERSQLERVVGRSSVGAERQERYDTCLIFKGREFQSVDATKVKTQFLCCVKWISR